MLSRYKPAVTVKLIMVFLKEFYGHILIYNWNTPLPSLKQFKAEYSITVSKADPGLEKTSSMNESLLLWLYRVTFSVDCCRTLERHYITYSQTIEKTKFKSQE